MRLLIFAAVVVLPLCGQESAPAEWREKVEAALKEGRERVALALLAKQLESAPPPADALELFADVAWNVGEFDRAEAAAKRWLEERPADAQARVAPGPAALEPRKPPGGARAARSRCSPKDRRPRER